MKTPFFILILGIFLAGCCTFSGSTKTVIPLEISSGYLSWVKAWQNKNDLYISGTANKPLGKDLGRAVIVATFFDETGKQIAQERTDVHPLRTHTIKGTRGRFVLKTPYLESIKTCKVELVWK